MPVGGSGGRSDGNGSAPGRNAKKVWAKPAARLAPPTPLLPLGDSERERRSSAIPQDTMTLDNSEHGRNRNSSDPSSVGAQESQDIPLKGSAGSPDSRSPEHSRSRPQSRVSTVIIRGSVIFSVQEKLAPLGVVLRPFGIARQVGVRL